MPALGDCQHAVYSMLLNVMVVSLLLVHGLKWRPHTKLVCRHAQEPRFCASVMRIS